MRDEEFIHICFSLTKHIFIVWLSQQVNADQPI
jgi:hypothetical protein